MTRSRRHSPFCSITCSGFRRGEKWWKRLAHRARRKWERSHPHLPPRDEREYANCWCWPKDGRQRFDPGRWPEAMRK